MNNTLCSRSWTDVNIDFFNGSVRHCCKSQEEKLPKNLTIDFFNNSSSIKNRRIDSLNNIQNKQCITCWDDYKFTGTAHRDHYNRWDSNTDVVDKINFIEIKLDNICDMSCVYCGEYSSSKIAKEKNKLIKSEIKKNNLEIFLNWLTTINLTDTNISFLGGEPSVSPNFYYFMERLKNIPIKNLSISFMTNANCSNKSLNKMFKLFDSLPIDWKINVVISNESKLPSELIRWGLNWERFEKNFIQINNNERINYLSLCPTISIFSIKHMYDYFEWVLHNLNLNKRFLITGNEIVNPFELCISNCPTSYKHYVDKCIELFSNNKQVFNVKKYDFLYVKNWMNILKQKIGTTHQDLDKLDIWFDKMYEQKKDKNVYKLKGLL